MSRNTCSMVNWNIHCIKKKLSYSRIFPIARKVAKRIVFVSCKKKKIDVNTNEGCNKKTCDPFNFQPLKLESKLRLYEMSPLKNTSRVGKWTSFLGRESLSEQIPIIGMHFYYTNS